MRARTCEIRWTENGITWHILGNATPNDLHVIGCDFRRRRLVAAGKRE